MAFCMATLIDQARAFADEDPDPESRDELRALVGRVQSSDAAALVELADRFSAPLEFGTAGLRGRVEGGLARMNRVVVIKAAHGLGTHLLARSEPGGPDPRRAGVVVGFDGRYSSRQFAEDTAAVLAALGIPALLFPDPVPTPLCSFATVHEGAAAGVMVTASHNPPKDNGYKVYRADGAQIIPPEDQAIASRIAAAPRVDQIARVAPPDAARSGLRRLVGDSTEAAYLEGIRAAALHPPASAPLRIVYTAMHGVGHRLSIRAFQQAGFEGVAVVPTQADPDGAFRTVAFPNPEEKGAMDRALALAREIEADLILANDPDADRLGAAVLDPATGSYRMLSGNEIGILLADDALAHADTKGRPKLVATSLVSSTLLSRMARDRGAVYAETLTGFKWIADAARRGEAAGQAFVFGYEEALGYTVGPLVRDKDGIGAAVRLADLARFLKGRGVSLLDRIDEILVAHGMSHEVQWSVTLSDAIGKKRIADAMEALRAHPPASLGESAIDRVLDLSTGEERAVGGATRPLGYPRANVLVFYAQDGARLTVRPSGTEPKIKFYIELVAAVKVAAEVTPARARLEARCGEIKAALNERLGFP
jgi:phosphomannomutase